MAASLRHLALLGLLAACGEPTVLEIEGFEEPGEGSGSDDVVAIGSEDTGLAPGVCVNELMPANRAAYAGEAGDFPDWLELHNPESHEVDLSGWHLSDDPDDLERHPLSGTIDDEGYLVLTAGGEEADVPFGLDAGGGSLILSDPWGGGSRIDYGEVRDDYAVARVSDCCTGEGCLDWSRNGTPGESNDDG